MTEIASKTSELIDKAVSSFEKGEDEDGARFLREAASLVPDDPKVQDALVRYSSGSSAEYLMNLCREFVKHPNPENGEKLLRRLKGPITNVSEHVTTESLAILLGTKLDGIDVCNDYQSVIATEVLSIRDVAAAILLKRGSGCKHVLALTVQMSSTETFSRIHSIGDQTAGELTTALLKSNIWSSASERLKYEKEYVHYCLQHLARHGFKNNRAANGVARLLTSDTQELLPLLDVNAFDLVLLCLDVRASVASRGQVTLALAKVFEIGGEVSQKLFLEAMAGRIAALDANKQNLEDHLIALLSIGSAVFPLIPSTAAQLFIADGFLSNLISLVEMVGSDQVTCTTLELLSAACIESSCREAVTKHCRTWLRGILSSADGPYKGQAALVMANTDVSSKNANDAKEESEASVSSNDADTNQLFETLKQLVMKQETNTFKSAIEGLTYLSLRPKVKQMITEDKALLQALMKKCESNTATFGILTLLYNITSYLPNLSEEQKKMSQLQGYANGSTSSTQQDPLNDDAHVLARCKALGAAGVVPYLMLTSKDNLNAKASPALIGTLSNILFSLAKDQKSRGTMAQQGAIPVLLFCFRLLKENPENARYRLISAHALARILISVNPKHVFASRPPSSAIPLLLYLIQEHDVGDGPRDLLPTFEGLMALTNLTSDPTLETTNEVVRSSLARIEDLLLSSNKLVQRAAAELVCNLVISPHGLEKFAEGSPGAARRLKILIALADVDDLATRRAAGGALASITEFPDAVAAIIKQERGIQILLDLCEDDEDPDKGCALRGVVCIGNIVMNSGRQAKETRQKIKMLEGIRILKGAAFVFRGDPDALQSIKRTLTDLKR
ncbi:hypothetical protein MMC25_003551 [Agyrium rufum]|nr:hypothetical protein [Agyrium rufum]